MHLVGLIHLWYEFKLALATTRAKGSDGKRILNDPKAGRVVALGTLR